MSAKLSKLILVSLNSPHLKTFYNLVSPLFEEILIVSDVPQDYCRTEVVDFRISKPISALRNIKKLRKIIKEFNPQLVHVHQANSVALVTGIALKRKSPMVLTTWGSDILVLPKQNIVKRKIAQLALKYADFITADASFMEEPIKDLCAEASVVIANFGIDISDVKVPLEEKENIIYSNRLHYSLYHIEDIILGFSNFVKVNTDWKLVIAGRGDLTEDLKLLAKKCLPQEKYEFIGFVDKNKNYEFYKKSKIWISVPESDGTSVSLLEAMSFGCIPVVSNLPANSEWVESGINGVTATSDVHNALEMASKMNLVEVYKINQEIIQTRATTESMRNLYAKLYERLI
jgi:glycosyltransferase involved in cell wall biosynthesis